MHITYQAFPDKAEYKSLLIINEEDRWQESLYFTFYKPWEEEEEQLYAGRYKSDVHFKDKECLSVLAFDFHRWDVKTIEQAIEMELPPVALKQPLRDLLERALEERDRQPEGFSFKVKV